MKLIAFVFLLTSITFAQNVNYSTFTVANNDSNATIDLGYDLSQIQANYYEGFEFRAIAILFAGTWTNTTFTVYAALTAAGTYYQVTSGGTALTITMSSNKWEVLEPIKFAGLRYIKLVGAEKEGGARTGYIIKRTY